MRKHGKIFSVLLMCSAVTAACVGLSGCSLLLNGLENKTPDEPGPGDNPGGSDITRTYTLDVALYDEYWADNVVDTSLWRVTSLVGAYAKDTLVLNGDGTYELTKEMGGDEVSDERWGSETDKNFNRYTYFGTYTAETDGVTITLSKCTKIAAEVGIYDMSLGYGLGNYEIEYTETYDLTFGAGTCHDETVVDLMYGVYIVPSDYGNCSQIIMLETSDYGTFKFVGLAEGDDTPDVPSVPDVPEKSGYTFISGTNAEITFDVYPDGTYTFAWKANNVSENGTYVYDRLEQSLTFTDPKGTDTEATIDGDSISFTYSYSVMAQLNQAYTGSVAEMEAVICEVLYEFIPATDGSVTLKLYADETYTYADEKNGVKETGAYDWNGETMTLTAPDDTTVESTLDGNLVKLTYTTGSSSQDFIGSLAAVSEVIPSAKTIYSFTPGTNAAITFELYDNGTYCFAWAANGVSETGTWLLKNGALIVTDPKGTTTTATVDRDEIAFTYYYSLTDQLNQPYTGSFSDLAKAAVEAGLANEIYAFTPGQNEAIQFRLYDNGAYCFEFTTYKTKEYGRWALIGDMFTAVDPTGSTTVARTSGDEISFKYNYSASSQLNQEYTGSVAALAKAMADAGISKKIYTFVSGTNEAIVFDLYDNGTYNFAWAANKVSEYGTWSFKNGSFRVTDPKGKVTTAALNGDEIAFTYYYSLTDQLNQAYTGSASAVARAVIESVGAREIYSFTPDKNDQITLDLYGNGAYRFRFATYNTNEYGIWSYANGELVLVKPDGNKVTATIDGDAISFEYVAAASAALNQGYSGSVAALVSAMIDSGEIERKYSFEPGHNALIQFHLYDSGIYCFNDNEHGVNEYGTWSFDGESFSVTDPTGKVTTATIDGDEISFTYYYSKMDALNQSYTGSVENLAFVTGIETAGGNE